MFLCLINILENAFSQSLTVFTNEENIQNIPQLNPQLDIFEKLCYPDWEWCLTSPVGPIVSTLTKIIESFCKFVMFVWGFCISWRYLLHFASLSEGTLYFDDILHTLQKSVREFSAYLSDIFYTSPFCVSVSHIILTLLMWRLQITLAKVNWWIMPEI